MIFENRADPQIDGWCYHTKPGEGDARKLVWLEQHGMEWVGIRAYNHQGGYWMVNNEPTGERVKAWRDLPKPLGHRIEGKLHFFERELKAAGINISASEEPK
jgi:hypothetical protein